MTKEFCTYNQALALKELGFDEPCFAVYYDTKEFKTYTGVWVKFNSEFNGKGVMSAPLYQQTFRWFREKHGLYVSINIHADNMWSVVVKSMTSNSTHTSGYVVDLINKGYSTFKTYEEAESACLDKLIEIIKNK